MYRASRDGNTDEAFHEKCDNKGATIVVAKIANTEQIVGGYNPLFWDSSNSYMTINDSFIYSFTDRNNFKSAKIGYSNGNKFSIGCYTSYGPIFGHSNDLRFYNGTWNSIYNQYSSYPEVDGIPYGGDFNVDDYEVFQVIKK